VSLDAFIREQSRFSFSHGTQPSFDGGRASRLVDWEFDEVAKYSLPERLSRYIETSEKVEKTLPDLEATYHITDIEAGLPALSRISQRLCAIRPAWNTESNPLTTATTTAPDDSLLREYEEATRDGSSTSENPSESLVSLPTVRELPSTSARNEVCVGTPEGEIARNGVTLTPASISTDAQPTPKDGDFRAAVLCTDERMSEELGVGDFYPETVAGADVDIVSEATRQQLRQRLSGGYDYVHFVGHADHDGLRCADGILDAGELTASTTSLVVLNACRSLQQGIRLLDSGVSGVVATRRRVANETALEAGQEIANLFAQGFTLQSMYRLLEAAGLADDYVPLGSPITSAFLPGAPQLYRVDSRGEDFYRLELELAFGQESPVGSHQYFSDPPGVELQPTLIGGHEQALITDSDGLVNLTPAMNSPVLFDGEYMHYSDLVDRLSD
jgi:hypothetical protein